MHQTPELPQRPDAGFSSLFDEHGSIIVLIDPATNQIHNANQAAAHFYGYTRAELCALRFDQLCTAGPEQLALALQRALRREQSRYVHIHRLAGGASRTVEVYMSPTTLDGQLVLFAIIHDITERMCTEEVLRQSELRYRTLLETLNVSVCCWLPDTTLLFANEQYRSIFGITGDPSGRQWLEFLPEAARAETAAFYHELATNPRTVSYEHPVTIGDGQVRHYSWIDTPIFDANRQLLEFQSVGIDITERKQAEEALRELNQTLEQRVRQRTVEVQDLYENAPVGYHSLDANGTVLMINQTQLDWLGHTRDELLGRSMASFLTPASMAAFDERFQAFKGQGSMRDLEFEMVRKDGSLIPILLSATAIYDEYGEYVMSRSTVFDNSEHKQAELALRESEEQNRLLFEESPDAVVLFRADGTLAQLNRAFEQLTGYSTAQLSGQTLASVGLVTAEKFLQLANLVTEHLKANTSFAL